MATLVFLWGQPASALDYPTRPVTIIVPFPAGGPLDVEARLVAKSLAERLGKPVVVDNRPGAGAAIGTRLAARAAPDGHTLLFGAKYLVLEPVLRGNVGFDPERDFAPVTLVSQTPFLLLVPATMPVRNVGEFVVYARQHAGTLTFGSAGTGTGPHLLGEIFKASAHVDIVHVPYKGSAPAVVDLVGGQISMAFVGSSHSVPLVRAGKLRALAVTASRRLEALPDVPTVAEAGLPGLEFQAWLGVLVPARTPEEIIARLNAEIVAIVKSAEFTRAIESGGGVVIPSSPQEFAQRIRTDSVAIAEFVRANNLRIEE